MFTKNKNAKQNNTSLHQSHSDQQKINNSTKNQSIRKGGRILVRGLAVFVIVFVILFFGYPIVKEYEIKREFNANLPIFSEATFIEEKIQSLDGAACSTDDAFFGGSLFEETCKISASIVVKKMTVADLEESLKLFINSLQADGWKTDGLYSLGDKKTNLSATKGRCYLNIAGSEYARKDDSGVDYNHYGLLKCTTDGSLLNHL